MTKNNESKVFGIKVIESFYGPGKNKASWVVLPCEKMEAAEIKKKNFSGGVIVFDAKKDAEKAVEMINSGQQVLEHNQYSRDVVVRQLPASLKPYAQTTSLEMFNLLL